MTLRNATVIVALLISLLIYIWVREHAAVKGGGSQNDSKPTRIQNRQYSDRIKSASDQRNSGLNQFMANSNSDWLESLEELAGRDPSAALFQFEKIDEPDSQALALRAIAAGWGRLDPHAAARWLEGLDSEEQQVDAIIGLVPVWVKRSAFDCLSWARELPIGAGREVSLVQIADSWTSLDPSTALVEYFKQEPEEGTERGLHVIASQWAIDAPEVAIDFIIRMKDEPRREEFLQTALVSLTNKDPMMAWRYSDRFSNPDVVEHARSMALEAISETNPQDAISLAEKHGNTEKLLSGIARGWAMLDENAAKTWAASIQDPEISARLIKSIEPDD